MAPDDVAQADHVKWRLDPAKSGKTSCTGDIGTHAAHLTTFVSGLAMTHRDGLSIAEDWLQIPLLAAGVEGVRFIEAAVQSHQNQGIWVTL